MPKYENNNIKGDLYITFDIDFPKNELTLEQKDLIKQIFNQESLKKVYNGMQIYSQSCIVYLII